MTRPLYNPTSTRKARVLPGVTALYDSLSPEKSELFQKNRLGKMEAPENTTQTDDEATFTPQALLEEFNADFLDLEKCRSWILAKVHPSGARCPDCESSITDPVRLRRFWTLERLRCPSCAKMFTALTGTFLTGSHMDPREIVLLTILLAVGMSNATIARILNNSPETIRLWNRKFRSPGRKKEINYEDCCR
jgi:transposase-like protein